MTLPRVTAILVLALLAGCASQRGPEPDRLTQVRQQVEQAKADPALSRFAPVAVHEAEQSVSEAERAWREGQASQVDHHLTVAERRLDIARARASSQAAVAERQELAQQGSRIQLESAQSRAARLEQELEGLRQRQTAQGTVFTLSEAYFDVGKAQLKPGAANRLQPLAQFLRANPDKAVTVEGHTDSTGSPDTNRQLSQARAEAVKQFLVGEGIEPGRVAARGMGEQFPVASNDTTAGRQQNRRVEVLVSEAR